MEREEKRRWRTVVYSVTCCVSFLGLERFPSCRASSYLTNWIQHPGKYIWPTGPSLKSPMGSRHGLQAGGAVATNTWPLAFLWSVSPVMKKPVFPRASGLEGTIVWSLNVFLRKKAGHSVLWLSWKIVLVMLCFYSALPGVISCLSFCRWRRSSELDYEGFGSIGQMWGAAGQQQE